MADAAFDFAVVSLVDEVRRNQSEIRQVQDNHVPGAKPVQADDSVLDIADNVHRFHGHIERISRGSRSRPSQLHRVIESRASSREAPIETAQPDLSVQAHKIHLAS